MQNDLIDIIRRVPGISYEQLRRYALIFTQKHKMQLSTRMLDNLKTYTQKSPQKGGVFRHHEEWEKRYLTQKIIEDIGEDYRTFIEAAVEEILKEEYDNLINDAVGAFMRLRKNGYTRNHFYDLYKIFQGSYHQRYSPCWW